MKNCKKPTLSNCRILPEKLCNSPATFQQSAHSILAGLKWKTCLNHVNNILIMGKLFEKTLSCLEEVLDRLQRAGSTLNLEKCKFFQPEIKFLGHLNNVEGRRSDPNTTVALTDLPIPTSMKELQSFLRGIGYWRSYLNDYCAIVDPLTALMKKSKEFVWDKEQ